MPLAWSLVSDLTLLGALAYGPPISSDPRTIADKLVGTGWRYVTRDELGLSDASYDDKFDAYGYFNGAVGANGYIAINETTGDIAVVFRGTEGVLSLDLLNDLLLALTSIPFSGAGGFGPLIEGLTHFITTPGSDGFGSAVYSAGHSLGGALAEFFWSANPSTVAGGVGFGSPGLSTLLVPTDDSFVHIARSMDAIGRARFSLGINVQIDDENFGLLDLAAVGGAVHSHTLYASQIAYLSTSPIAGMLGLSGDVRVHWLANEGGSYDYSDYVYLQPFLLRYEALVGGNGADIVDMSAAPVGLGVVVDGGYGNDSLSGSYGSDILAGGPGLDNLRGRTGNDLLYGGQGSDFYSIGFGEGVDTISDSSGSDTLRFFFGSTLASLDPLNTSTAGEATLIGRDASGAVLGSLRFIANPSGTGLIVLALDAAGAETGRVFFDGMNTPATRLEWLSIFAGSEADQVGTTIDLIGRVWAHVSGVTPVPGGGDDWITLGSGLDDINLGEGYDVIVVDYSGATTGVSDQAYLTVFVPSGGTVSTYSVFGPPGQVEIFGAEATVVYGGSGDDRLGGAWWFNSNTFYGGAGNDRLYGTNGDDVLDGGDGDDFISMSNWFFVAFIPGGGVDWVDGGTGFDEWEARYADSTVNFVYDSALAASAAGLILANGTTIRNVEHVISLILGSGNDQVWDDAYDNVFELGAGDDWVRLTTGRDNVYAGAGHDTVVIDCSGDAQSVSSSASVTSLVLFNSSGTRNIIQDAEQFTLIGTSFNDALSGHSLSDTLNGGAGDDRLSGNAGGDALDGGDGADTAAYANSTTAVTVNLAANIGVGGDATGDTFLSVENVEGSAFSDVLIGDGLANVLNGGAGGDVLRGGAGGDTLNGGDGVDTASYSGSSAGVTVNLLFNVGSGGDAAGDTFVGIENITGSDWNDSLTGNFNANVLVGGAGADALNGSGGADTASYAGSSAGVSINLSTGAAAGGDATGDTFIEIENLTGSAFNDVLAGDANGNVLIGGLGADVLDGGGGGDTVSYAGSSVGVSVNLLTGLVSGGDAAGDTLLGIESLVGSAVNDVLRGNSAANTLSGGDGIDNLIGDDGNDTITGGGGQDAVSAGSGDDVIFYNFGDGVDSIDGGVGVDLIFTQGNSGNETLDAFWNGSSFTFFKGGGVTSIEQASANLGDGVDWLRMLNSSVAVTINLGLGAATGFISITSVENAWGSALNDTLTGSIFSNIIRGGAGDDLIDGGFGSDTLIGDDGADTIFGGDGSDGIYGLAGADTIDAGAGHDTIYIAFGEGVDTINGGDGNDRIVCQGNSGAESLEVTWNGASFTFFKGGAVTSIESAQADMGLGGDWVRYTNSSVGIEVNFNFSFATGFTNLWNCENAAGGGFSDTLIGNGLANNLLGNGGGDTIDGGWGNDTLNGGAGADTLTGGADSDALTGGADADTFVFATGSGADSINDFDADGAGGQDFIDLTGYGITAIDFAARVVITDQGANTLITIDGVNTIILHGVTGDGANLITQTDFILGP